MQPARATRWQIEAPGFWLGAPVGRFVEGGARARHHDEDCDHAAQGRGQTQSRQSPRHRLGDTTPSGVGGRQLERLQQREEQQHTEPLAQREEDRQTRRAQQSPAKLADDRLQKNPRGGGGRARRRTCLGHQLTPLSISASAGRCRERIRADNNPQPEEDEARSSRPARCHRRGRRVEASCSTW